MNKMRKWIVIINTPISINVHSNALTIILLTIPFNPCCVPIFYTLHSAFAGHWARKDLAWKTKKKPGRIVRCGFNLTFYTICLVQLLFTCFWYLGIAFCFCLQTNYMQSITFGLWLQADGFGVGSNMPFFPSVLTSSSSLFFSLNVHSKP